MNMQGVSVDKRDNGQHRAICKKSRESKEPRECVMEERS